MNAFFFSFPYPFHYTFSFPFPYPLSYPFPYSIFFCFFQIFLKEFFITSTHNIYALLYFCKTCYSIISMWKLFLIIFITCKYFHQSC